MPKSLKKSRTMAETAEEGNAYLKRAWGEDKLQDVKKTIDERHSALEKTNETDESESAAKTAAVDSTATSSKETDTEKAAEEKTTTTTTAAAASDDKSKETVASTSDDKEEEEVETPKKKVKLAKHTTMVTTAEEGKSLLHGTEIDTDAKTRHQSKAIKEITKKSDDTVVVNSTKASLRKTSTMAKTTQEAEHLLKGERLGSTRSKSKADSKKEEPKAKSKAKLTKSRTMKETAKEGKAFVKAANARKRK